MEAKVKKQEATEARDRRIEMAELNRLLAAKQCPRCGTTGAWKVYNVDRGAGRTRYVKCLACHACDQVPVIVKENPKQEKGNGKENIAAEG